jgi:hypothetical protein
MYVPTEKKSWCSTFRNFKYERLASTPPVIIFMCGCVTFFFLFRRSNHRRIVFVPYLRSTTYSRASSPIINLFSIIIISARISRDFRIKWRRKALKKRRMQFSCKISICIWFRNGNCISIIFMSCCCLVVSSGMGILLYLCVKRLLFRPMDIDIYWLGRARWASGERGNGQSGHRLNIA